jgi:hypothetical protein
MFTIAKRLGILATSLLILGLAVAQVSAQGSFNVGQGLNLAGGMGGGAHAPQGAGAGFNVNVGAAPKAAGFNPFQNLVSNPYGPAAATMTSQNYVPPPPTSEYGGYGNYIYPDPYGGYLKGAADVINAQGRYLISTQQAYMMKEDVKRLQIANKRAAFEEWLWERANTPTLEDQRIQSAKENLRRAQNDPPLPEIWSGQALNVLLQNAQKLSSGKVQAPNIQLDEEVVNKINLNSGKAGINFGLLKNEGKLSWPLALRDLQPAGESKELRDQLQTLAKVAFDKAKEGQVDPGTIREMEATADKLDKMLKRNVGDMPFAQYSEGKRYLNQLNDGLKALKEPNAADFANGKFKLKGNTLADLLDYMTKNGLQFAPAVAGEEAAYVALHRALVAYGAGMGNNLAAER